MLIELETPRFSQAEVLKMLPDLKPKQLQNWSGRGVLDEGDQRPGKGSRRLYTCAGVIALDFMQRLTEFGVPPSAARAMSDVYVNAAADFLESGPETIVTEKGSRWIPVRKETMDRFRRAFIVRIAEGEYHMKVEGDPVLEKIGAGISDRISNTFGIFIELDFLIAMAVNRIFLFENGEL